MASSVLAIPSELGALPVAGRPAGAVPLPAPSILFTATLHWPFAARLAAAFADAGCHVEALCPRGHPLSLISAVGRVHRHSVPNPLGALRRAIGATAPTLIVPCDDAAAVQLDALYRAAAGQRGQQALRTLIERSLGAPGACPLATTRETLMDLASKLGVRHPGTATIDRLADLEAWLGRHGFPAVLKQDRTCGGQGIAIVRGMEEARRAFARLSAPQTLFNAAARLLLDRDGTMLRNRIVGPDPAVSVQKFISGAPANRAVACWRGEVLAGVSLEAVETQDATGPATVVKVIDNREMSEAARRLVAHLGLSGFWGFDFVLGAQAACLIEVNPRATPACGLPAGDDLPAALVAALTGAAGAVPPRAIRHPLIAVFPGEWRRAPDSVYLRSAWHDVPWSEPALVRDCLMPPWSERGWIARLWARMRVPKKNAARVAQAALR